MYRTSLKYLDLDHTMVTVSSLESRVDSPHDCLSGRWLTGPAWGGRSSGTRGRARSARATQATVRATSDAVHPRVARAGNVVGERDHERDGSDSGGDGDETGTATYQADAVTGTEAEKEWRGWRKRWRGWRWGQRRKRWWRMRQRNRTNSGAQRTRWRWRTHVTFIPPLPGGRRAPAPRDR
jgi:hypothetical protein